MKIVDIRLTGLSGGTVEGGWTEELKPDDDLNTVVEVLTDEGLVGIGSAMTSKALVEGSVKLLRPLLLGERADEPARVSEKLRQCTFWQGRGGAVEHAISGLDIALWDLFGKITNQPVGRLLGGCYRNRIKPYGSMLFDEPPRLREKLQQAVARGFKAIKLGWRPFGRRDRQTDELLVKTARDTVGPNVELMVDAGGSDQFWPHGYKWALETAKMLAAYDVVWFEEALPPDDLEGFIELRRAAPLPITTGEVLTRRQSFRPFLERDRGVAHRLDGVRAQRAVGAARLEHGDRSGRGSATRRRDAGGALRRILDALAVHRGDHHRAVQGGRRGVSADSHGQAGTRHRTEPGSPQAVRRLTRSADNASGSGVADLPGGPYTDPKS